MARTASATAIADDRLMWPSPADGPASATSNVRGVQRRPPSRDQAPVEWRPALDRARGTPPQNLLEVRRGQTVGWADRAEVLEREHLALTNVGDSEQGSA